MTSDTLALRVCLYDVNWRRSKGNRKRQTSKVKRFGNDRRRVYFPLSLNLILEHIMSPEKCTTLISLIKNLPLQGKQ